MDTKTALDNLYKVFFKYPPKFDTGDTAHDVHRLRKDKQIHRGNTRRETPQEAAADFIQYYADSPKSLKYILPRALEVGEYSWCEIKFGSNGFHSWPDEEKNAVVDYLQAKLAELKLQSEKTGEPREWQLKELITLVNFVTVGK